MKMKEYFYALVENTFGEVIATRQQIADHIMSAYRPEMLTLDLNKDKETLVASLVKAGHKPQDPEVLKHLQMLGGPGGQKMYGLAAPESYSRRFESQGSQKAGSFTALNEDGSKPETASVTKLFNDLANGYR